MFVLIHASNAAAGTRTDRPNLTVGRTSAAIIAYAFDRDSPSDFATSPALSNVRLLLVRSFRGSPRPTSVAMFPPFVTLDVHTKRKAPGTSAPGPTSTLLVAPNHRAPPFYRGPQKNKPRLNGRIGTASKPLTLHNCLLHSQIERIRPSHKRDSIYGFFISGRINGQRMALQTQFLVG